MWSDNVPGKEFWFCRGCKEEVVDTSTNLTTFDYEAWEALRTAFRSDESLNTHTGGRIDFHYDADYTLPPGQAGDVF